jgi:hypothetical protein
MERSIEAMRLCSNCGGIIDDGARFCRFCGFDTARLTASAEGDTAATENLAPESENKTRRGNNTILYALGGVAVLIALVVAGFIAVRNFSNRNNQSSNLPETSNANSSSPSPFTLTAKAQQVEEKILRGEALSANDLEGLSTSELRILRNVHFARYGRKYDKGALGDYFTSRPWYKPNSDYKDSMLTATDKANIDLIVAAEGNSNNQTAAATTTTSSPTPQANPTPMRGELTREAVLSLLSSYRKDVIASLKRPQYEQKRYERLINDKIISCKKFYPIQGVTNIFEYSNCSPASNGRGLIKKMDSVIAEVGYKVPSRVNGISKVDANTSYADVVFSFQAGDGYSLYIKNIDDFVSSIATNLNDETRRVILRLYDDGWRVERVD